MSLQLDTTNVGILVAFALLFLALCFYVVLVIPARQTQETLDRIHLAHLATLAAIVEFRRQDIENNAATGHAIHTEALSLSSLYVQTFESGAFTPAARDMHALEPRPDIVYSPCSTQGTISV